MTEFEAVIGLEIHAQISSKTKMFCGCDNDSFGKEANTNVCPICMGFPGVLPVPNEEAIKKGIKAAMALKCSIPLKSKFDRKNYFYPDLPYGFQISQFDEPVSQKGKVKINIENEKKEIGITRLHLENDAGKLSHTGKDTLLDFNRSGTPLMEIVSDPDMRNAKEAREYAETVRTILRFVNSSDCDMEKGMMRFDASVSIRPKGDTNLNARAEIKNLNSFRSLEAAIEYEIKRQIKMWNDGTPLSVEQTVGWDDDRGTTQVMREKESSADYRYFPEPDIPPIEVTEEILEAWRKELPELPHEMFDRFVSEYELQEQEAKFYTVDLQLATFFEEVAKKSGNPKAANSFIGTVLIKKLKDASLELSDCLIKSDDLADLIKLIDEGAISNNVAKTTVFDEMMNSGKNPRVIVEEQGIAQVSDTSEIEKLCKAAIDANPQALQDIKEGKLKAMAALVGFVMKESRGQANPKMVNDILSDILL